MSASGHESEMPALLVYVGYWGSRSSRAVGPSTRPETSESTVQRPTKFKLIFHGRDSLQSPHQRIHAFHNPPLPKSIRQGC